MLLATSACQTTRFSRERQGQVCCHFLFCGERDQKFRQMAEDNQQLLIPHAGHNSFRKFIFLLKNWRYHSKNPLILKLNNKKSWWNKHPTFVFKRREDLTFSNSHRTNGCRTHAHWKLLNTYYGNNIQHLTDKIVTSNLCRLHGFGWNLMISTLWLQPFGSPQYIKINCQLWIKFSNFF